MTAHLLSDARSGGDRPGASDFHALVRWRDHMGVAPVRAWLHRGQATTVWLDGRGAIAAPPEARDLAATVGVAVGFATAFGGVAIAYGAWRAIGRSIDRRRVVRWTREWERVEPGWAARYGS